jgi:hypothetical protein
MAYEILSKCNKKGLLSASKDVLEYIPVST